VRTAERWWVHPRRAGFVREIGKHSTFHSTAQSDERRPQLRVRAPRAIRRARNGNASGGEKRLAMAKASYCRKANRDSTRRHPICSTERAFQLKLATSVIAHLFSEARSQERSFSKGRSFQEQLARAAPKSRCPHSDGSKRSRARKSRIERT